ncbi:MAG: PilN domain-containing protein [Burkholderiales bacterium]|nr:PilN domain-containing protein [Burkholderiales bacterium]
MMRALALDFAPRRRAGAWIGWVILLAGVIAAGLTVERLESLEKRRELLEARMQQQARASGRSSTSGAAAESPQAAERRTLARRAIVRGLGRPWDALFADIESAAHEDVALLAIEPDVRRGDVRISGEARDAPALSAYIAHLERTHALERVHLVQHERVADAGERALRFTVSGYWVAVRK